MTSARQRKWLVSAVLAIQVVGLAPALSQLDYGFMPKGGKALLVEVLGEPADQNELGKIIKARRSEAEWRSELTARAGRLNERELHTLAAYLAVNMPVPEPERAIAKAAKRDELYGALPRDGRELAWNECQFCHSLFTSHLTQERGVQAWLNMFQSPFHREIKMTAQEREEFSRYSAINMPMKIEAVPPDLRF
jgi:hypothetical protein